VILGRMQHTRRVSILDDLTRIRFCKMVRIPPDPILPKLT
jgi:hypothetical protein